MSLCRWCNRFPIFRWINSRVWKSTNVNTHFLYVHCTLLLVNTLVCRESLHQIDQWKNIHLIEATTIHVHVVFTWSLGKEAVPMDETSMLCPRCTLFSYYFFWITHQAANIPGMLFFYVVQQSNGFARNKKPTNSPNMHNAHLFSESASI